MISVLKLLLLNFRKGIKRQLVILDTRNLCVWRVNSSRIKRGTQNTDVKRNDVKKVINIEDENNTSTIKTNSVKEAQSESTIYISFLM